MVLFRVSVRARSTARALCWRLRRGEDVKKGKNVLLLKSEKGKEGKQGRKVFKM